MSIHSKILQIQMSIESNSIYTKWSNLYTVNANFTGGTFVCINCFVIHRELGYFIKNIATDSFISDEIQRLQLSINSCVNQVWLVTLSSGDCKINQIANKLACRYFLELKYVKRR
jgi:hypothetical protein